MMKANKSVIFNLLVFLILLLGTFAVFLTGCDTNQCLETVPFTLKERIGSQNIAKYRVTLIRNTDEFEKYVGNTILFEEELSEEFKAVNAQYTEEYFENNYLVAIIEWANSPAISGYKLVSIETQNSTLFIELEAVISDRHYINCDMGEKYTYYITVEKDETLTEAKLKYK